jgi:hypothetical protein
LIVDAHPFVTVDRPEEGHSAANAETSRWTPTVGSVIRCVISLRDSLLNGRRSRFPSALTLTVIGLSCRRFTPVALKPRPTVSRPASTISL